MLPSQVLGEPTQVLLRRLLALKDLPPCLLAKLGAKTLIHRLSLGNLRRIQGTNLLPEAVAFLRARLVKLFLYLHESCRRRRQVMLGLAVLAAARGVERSSLRCWRVLLYPVLESIYLPPRIILLECAVLEDEVLDVDAEAPLLLLERGRGRRLV